MSGQGLPIGSPNGSPTAPKMPIELFAVWLATGERGISSEAIVSHLTGVPVGRYSGGGFAHPYDPADLRRCELLLRQVPIARLIFPTIASRSKVWAALVAEWDDLVALAEEECPGVFSTPNPDGRAPRLYKRMCELRGVS